MGFQGGVWFPAGTPVRMAHGKDRPIEELRVGDEIASAHHLTGKPGYSRVTRTFRREHDTLLEIRTEDGGQVEATPEHPFWVEGKGFIAARRLARSDLLRAGDGHHAAVTSITERKGRFAVYNLEVEGTHTYYAGGWWVHNDCSDIAVGHFDGHGGAGDIFRFEPGDWPQNSPGGGWNFHDFYMRDGMVYDSGRGHGPMPFDDWTQTWGGSWDGNAMRPWGADEWNGWWDRELIRHRYGGRGPS